MTTYSKTTRRRRLRVLFLVVAVLTPLLAITPASAQGEEDIGGSDNLLVVAPEQIWSITSIPVCWENAPDRQIEKRWSQEAVERTWEAVSGVDFTGWGDCSRGSQGVRIQVADTGPHVKALGKALDGMVNGMVLNFQFQNWSEECIDDREFCIRAIAVHEFGHALGFSHEHNRDDRRRCGESPQGTTGTLYLTDYDPNSVMNYCSPQWNNDGNLTPLDVAGVRSVYGPFTAETPARFEGEVAIWIRDDELFGSDQFASEEFPFSFEFSSNQPQEQNFRLCAGDEVRVEVQLRAALLPRQARVQFTATSELFEGGTCSTRDREDDDTKTESLTLVSTGSGDIEQRLVNGGLGGGDEATVDITFFPSADEALDRARDGGCTSCEDASREATFGKDPIFIVPVRPVFPGPTQPTIPGNPTLPTNPDAPTIPGRPTLPANPTTPTEPANPAEPADPGKGVCRGVAVTVNLSDGDIPTAGDDVILGTAFDDVIDGLAGNDLICAGGGDDKVQGGEGKDRIFGGNGDDELFGGPDRDRMYGGAGNDKIVGNGGWDLLFGGADADIIRGGYGKDIIRGAGGNDVIDGGPGRDEIRGGSGQDRLLGGGGKDLLIGGVGNDVLRGGNGPDVLRGLGGDDMLRGENGMDRCVGGAGADTAVSCETEVTI